MNKERNHKILQYFAINCWTIHLTYKSPRITQHWNDNRHEKPIINNNNTKNRPIYKQELYVEDCQIRHFSSNILQRLVHWILGKLKLAQVERKHLL